MNNFKSDRDKFIISLSEYAAEFAMAFNYNPFLVDKNSISSFIPKLQNDLSKENNSFVAYSASKSNHMPKAILGKENYVKFLESLSKEKQESTLLKQTPQVQIITKNPYNYTQDELRKNFIFRLITQDRFYEFLYYPVSVLKKLFYNYDRRAFFDKWIEKQIDNIILHVGEADQIKFKDVTILDITKEHSVLINDKFNLYTVVAGTDTKEKLNTKTLQNIVIDHVEPLIDIIFELQSKLPTLRSIHNVLENINNGRISNKEDLNNAGNYLVNNVDFSSKELDTLENELILIASKIKLQLMDRYENLYKRL